VSVFAGRIADTGVDPMPHIARSPKRTGRLPQAGLALGQRARVLNIFQADACGCDIVTVPHDVFEQALKLAGIGLKEMSLDTVKMFAGDAKAAGDSRL